VCGYTQGSLLLFPSVSVDTLAKLGGKLQCALLEVVLCHVHTVASVRSPCPAGTLAEAGTGTPPCTRGMATATSTPSLPGCLRHQGGSSALAGDRTGGARSGAERGQQVVLGLRAFFLPWTAS